MVVMWLGGLKNTEKNSNQRVSYNPMTTAAPNNIISTLHLI